MLAVRMHELGHPNVLRLEELPTPEPRAGEVRVAIKSISVNFSEVLIRKGLYPYMPDLPVIPGAECSGVIDAVGSGVQHWQEGEAVLVVGQPAYSSFLCVPVSNLIRIPKGVSFDAAAAMPIIYLTAYHMLHTVRRVRPGEQVLIYAAAGGVGTAVIQLAQLAGLKTIGLTSRDNKVAFLQQQGVDCAINYQKEHVVERVMEATNGKGVDLILDSVGGDTFDDNFRMLNALGQVIWFGFAKGFPKTNLLKWLASHPALSQGVSMFHLFSIFRNRGLLYSSLQHLMRLLAEKKIEPIIHSRIPLQEAAEAHQMLEEGRNIGKIILYPDNQVAAS